MKPVRKASSYILLVGVMGLSIVGGVVIYQIYSASVKSQATPEQLTAIKPLDGVINQATVDSLKKRTVYTDTQLRQFLLATPTPEIVEATSAAEPEAVVTIAPESTSATETKQ